MPNTDSNLNTESQVPSAEPSFLKKNTPLVIGAAVLAMSSGLLGYTVGHRQGLTVVGFDADAEQLVEVVQKQKESLAVLNKVLNATVQERDVAIGNSNDLYAALNKAKDQQTSVEGLSILYREILRQRGGLPLAVQHLAIKPLPENAFEYQLDLVQINPAKRPVSGSAEIRLIRGTDVLVVPMQDKTFNFENYERLTGRWTMPKGFNPQFVEVRLTGAKPVIRRFSWGRGEAIENQSAFLSEIPQSEANAQ